MAQWYSLGCLECKLFVDLHKFLPTHAWYERFAGSRWDYDLFPGQSTYCVARLSAPQFAQELKSFAIASKPDYVRKLVPQLVEFCQAHQVHRLFVISDMGDRPWNFRMQGWWEWKEKPVAFDFHTYLPRNLVEDQGIRDWPSAVCALEDHPSGYNFPLEATSGDALEFKLAFEQVVAKQMSEPSDN